MIHHQDPCLLDQERYLLNQLQLAYLNEESLWKQKSRIQWLKEGDRNTRYFHLTTMAHRSNNRIFSLIDREGHTLSQSDEIEDHIVSFFHSLLNETKEPRNVVHSQLLPLIPKLITEEQNHFLNSPVSEEEIKVALFHLKPYGALGPDGYPQAFSNIFGLFSTIHSWLSFLKLNMSNQSPPFVQSHYVIMSTR